MRGFWKRRRGEGDVGARLRHARPEPPSALVDAIVRRVEGRRWSRVVGVRVGLAAAATVLFVAAVASFGGAGYASIALDNARSAVKDAVAPSKDQAKGSGQQNASGRREPAGAVQSPSQDQYGPDRVTICHRTPSGNEKTLVLPQPAANAHLRNHEEDTPGPCPA